MKYLRFTIPIGHIVNTFNFYNRSSFKTEMRLFGM